MESKKLAENKYALICGLCLRDGIVPPMPEVCPAEHRSTSPYPYVCYLGLYAERKAQSAKMKADMKQVADSVVANILKKDGA